MPVPKNEILDAYNWAVKQFPDLTNPSVERLDTYMTKLMGSEYLAFWDYFDVYGYIVDGLDGKLIIRKDDTGEFGVVNQQTLPCECKNENDWLIEHHGRGSVVFVVMGA